MIKLPLSLALFLGFLFASFSPVVAAQPTRQNQRYVPDEIIVKFRPEADESQKDLARFRVFGARKKAFKVLPNAEVVKLGRGVTVEEATKF